MAFRPFFPPSPEITNQLMTRMGRRRAEVLAEAAKEMEPSEGDEMESDELLNSLLAALEEEPEPLAETDWEDQRWLSDTMYHFLGRMAGRARRNANTFMVTDAIIIDGMSTSLGLYEVGDFPLLVELADEFSSWLSNEPNKSYVAGWGRLVRNPYDQFIYLEPFSRDVSSVATETDPYREIQIRDLGGPFGVGSKARAAAPQSGRAIEADQNIVKPRSQ